MSFLTGNPQIVHIVIHAQPKASRTKIVGVYGDALKIAVNAPPVDGAANEALVEFLSEFFHIAKRNINLESGATSRRKVFSVKIDLPKARELLSEFLYD